MATPPMLPKPRGAVSAIIATGLAAFLMVAVSVAQWGETPEPLMPIEEVPAYDPPPPPVPPSTPPEEKPEDPEITPPPEPPPPPPTLAQLEWRLGGGIGIPIPSVTDILPSEALEDIVDTTALDSPPEPVRQIKPMAPQDRRGQHAEVQVLLVIDTQGNVQNAEIWKSTNAGFNRAALDAARRWTFTPGYVNGKAVKFKIILPMIFNSR